MATIYGYADTEKRLLKKLPKEVESLDDIDRVHEEMKEDFNSIEDKGLGNKFSRWRKKRQINKIEENKNSPLHHGAKGELRVLDELDDLPDYYHVLCGVNMDLGRYVTYNGRKNLRSAQMDFVVVSRRGVVMIEVKNWSRNFSPERGKLSPFEQVDRAGRVLWISLQSWRSPRKPKVTSVLLSIQYEMNPDPRYKFVNVKTLRNINSFIQSRYEQFSDKEVERVVGRIKGHVTK